MTNMKYLYHYTILFLLVASCGETKQEAPAQQEPAVLSMSAQQLKLMDIQLGTPQEGIIQTTVEAPGKVVILSQYQASVMARISGNVEKVHVLEGQKVQKGQRLVTLSSVEFINLQEQYLTNRANAIQSELEWDRQRSLKADKAISDKEYQLAQSRYEVSMAAYKASESRIKLLGLSPEQLYQQKQQALNYDVVAPISGYLLKLPISLGQGVNAQTELAHIVNMEQYHADLFVYEKDVQDVYEGQEVELSFADQRLAKARGVVEFISRGMEAANRTVLVHVVFDAPKGMILPDMSIRARLKSKPRKGFTVAEGAVMISEEGAFVYSATETDKGYQFTKVPVSVGSTAKGRVEILYKDTSVKPQQIVETGTLLVEGMTKKEED